MTDPIAAAEALGGARRAPRFAIERRTVSRHRPRDDLAGAAEGRIRLAQVGAGDRAVVIDASPLTPGRVAHSGDRRIATSAGSRTTPSSSRAGSRTTAALRLLPMFDTRWVFVRERARRTGLFKRKGEQPRARQRRSARLPLSKEERLSDWSADSAAQRGAARLRGARRAGSDSARRHSSATRSKKAGRAEAERARQ